MIRAFWLRLFVALSAVIGLGGPAGAQTDAEALAGLLRLDDVIAVLCDEGRAYGADLDRDLLDGQGGAFWAKEVARIYRADRFADAMLMTLSTDMTDQQRAQTAVFFDTALGQRIVSLETSARVAMVNHDVEQGARATFDRLKGTDDPRMLAVSRFVVVNDLLERNVAGALSANYHFLVGMAEGGAKGMTDRQIVAEVWAQEQDIRDETESWLFGYLLMAYHPLKDAELQAYIDFSDSPAGRALNAALFEAFDAGYRGISHDLGQLIAKASASSDL